MIILDTNVVSEAMRQARDAALIAWLNGQEAGAIWTTAITVFEIRSGIEFLPAGRRRDRLAAAFEGFLETDLQRRVVGFDAQAARAAATLAGARRRVGRIIDMPDTLIAGVVLATGATLATRNARHFSDLPIDLVDPWAG